VPTATTFPRCGFSFAVSGMMIPLAVVVSAGLASTSTRSARGFTLTDMMKLFNRLIDF
jgi:hypothetical protein